MTMQLLEEKIVTSAGINLVEFTSIPQTGRDLLVTASTRHTGTTADNFLLMYSFGTVANTNYVNTLLGNGSTLSAITTLVPRAAVSAPSNSTANTFSNATIYIPGYSVSIYRKMWFGESYHGNNGNPGAVSISGGRFSTTGAITSLAFQHDNPAADFEIGSRISLYILGA